MKNQPFRDRLRYALRGIHDTWLNESSFRTQVVAGAIAVALLAVLRPSLIWWAVMILLISSILALELVNTALEHVIDKLHPESHPTIGLAKDCAAGAVLVLSACSLIAFALLLLDTLH